MNLTIAVGSTCLPLITPIYSIDFSQGETSPSGCRCHDGGQCDCWTPRKPSGRRRSSVHHDLKAERNHQHLADSTQGIQGDPSSPLSSHVLARIAELRPVLPRPSRHDGPLHDPSSNILHNHSGRHHTHENMYFSPYSRAYEHIHTPDHHEMRPVSQTGDKRASPVRHQPPVQRNVAPGAQSGSDAWQVPGVFPSACTCGDSCRCPGCSQHSGSPIAPGGAYAACTNPSSCSFCLDCTILSLPPSSAPPSIDSTSDSQAREFEEWLRHISTSPTTGAVMPSGFSPYEMAMNPMAAFPSPITNSNSNSGPQPQARPSQHPPSADSGCHGRCYSPNGACSCSSRSGGCECDTGLATTAPGAQAAVYTQSGERNTSNPANTSDPSPTSVGVTRRSGSLRVPDYMTMTAVRDGLTASVANRPSPVGASSGTGSMSFYPDAPSFLSVGDAPSRSSSSSSLSSRMSGRSPNNTVRAFICSIFV